MPQDEQDIDQSNEEARFSEPQVVRFTLRRRISGSRLDKYLHGRLPRLSRTMLQRLIRDGAVTVNGSPTKASYEPASGDVVEVIVPPPEPTDIIPQDIPLDILYEDDYLLAINKQVGIICHPASGSQTGTLANALTYYSQSLSKGSDAFRPGIVHRLDKNTTGVMLVAKTDEAHWRLALQFERRTVRKTYLAVVEGAMQLDADIIDQPLAHHPLIKDRYVVAGRAKNNQLFKQAVTRYEVAERFNGFTLVRLHPKTGRTHQLRVHLSAIGHPMMGDTYYGGHLFSERDLSGAGSTDPLIMYQSLHAWRIEFTHPIKETPVQIEAPIPRNLESIIELLRRHRPRTR